MNILNGLQNFLEFINNNWTTIIVIIGLLIAIYRKARDFFSKSNDEKVAIAKAQIKETMLRMVTEAEVTYEEWNKAGSIKRSQVIEEIYKEYPILSKVVDQTALVEWIDETIDESLKTLREIVSSNADNEAAK